MTKRTSTKTDSKGREEVWEWEETPETVAALKKLHETVRKNNEALNS
tara:strand:- start:703 stop:843 length:141 start_codon:yes stop_codon:yes gene_type:complete